ncbi:MAG: radical SAM protein [Elusimicrobiales bacterium]|jgi:hypothetical protein
MDGHALGQTVDIRKLGIVVGTACNFNCSHCLIKKEDRRERLSLKEVRLLCDTVARYRPKSILFTGGEPTFWIKEINEIISSHPCPENLKITLTTNGHFAGSVSLAKKVLSSFTRLDYVQLSYDVFHKIFLSFSKAKNLHSACTELRVGFSAILTMSSPLDLLLVKQLRSFGRFKIGVQKVASIGEAKRNGIRFIFPCFDEKVLSKYCPNRNSLGYICGRGFSICCAELAFNNSMPGVFHSTLGEHLASPLYGLMRKHNFAELMKILRVPKKSLLPDHSSECVLCDHIFKNARRKVRLTP